MTVTRTDLPDDDWPEWDAEFSAICDSHRARLVRWLTSIFGAGDAEDIAQEALVRLYVRPGMLHEDADAWPWLAVVARNVGRDMARHNAYSTTVDADLLNQVPDDAGVHDAVVARDDAERLTLALRSISPRDRALLHLRDVEGVGVAEIADRLGLNDNAARQQIFRARRRLANAYLALGGDRRTGIVALLGLKVRELLRRHGHLAPGAGPASTGLAAAVVPALTALVGGALLWITGGGSGADAPPRGHDREAYGETPHGVGGVRPDSVSPSAWAAARAAARATGGSAFFEHSDRVGNVEATARLRDPLDNSPGPGHRIGVYVSDVPVLGYVSIGPEEWYSSEDPLLCGVHVSCPTAVPTPTASAGR